MISNVMIEIDGRRALPLRALPFVCAWAEAPDSLVLAMRLKHTVRIGREIQQMAGRRVEIQNRRSLRAYKYFADGTWQPISPSQWEAVEVELRSLTKKFQADEREGADGENHAAWRVQATLMLPDDVFVWVDEFEHWFEASRPLAVPTDDDLDLWRIEQARLYKGEDLAMVLDEGMTEFDRIGRLDFGVVVLPVELNGKIWRYCPVSPAAINATSAPVTSRRGGRPRTFAKKVSAISAIMGQFGSIGAWEDPMALPGCCGDLLDACERIERSVTAKSTTFSVTEVTFRMWLTSAGVAAEGHPFIVPAR